MKKLIPSFAMVIAGCAVQPLQPTPGETTKEPSPAPATAMMLPPVLQPSPGFSTTWAEIGYPFDARKIAACGPNEDDPNGLWALNADNTLWYSPNGGAAPSSWTYQATVPSAEYIVCDAALLYVFTTDKTIQATPGFPSTTTPFAGWASIGAWDDAHLLFGGLGSLGTLNLNGDFYYSSTYLTGVGPTEKFVVDGFTDPLIASGGDAYWALSPITPLAANSTTRVTSAGCTSAVRTFRASRARSCSAAERSSTTTASCRRRSAESIWTASSCIRRPPASRRQTAGTLCRLRRPPPSSRSPPRTSRREIERSTPSIRPTTSGRRPSPRRAASTALTTTTTGSATDTTRAASRPTRRNTAPPRRAPAPASPPDSSAPARSERTPTGFYWTTCVNGEATSTWEGSSCNTQFCCGPQ